MWSVWVTRNNIVFKRWDLNMWYTCRRATSLLSNYQKKNKIEEKNKIVAFWSPPPNNIIKINTNATYLGNFSWSLGIVCRNSRGEMFQATTRLVEAASVPMMAECLVEVGSGTGSQIGS